MSPCVHAEEESGRAIILPNTQTQALTLDNQTAAQAESTPLMQPIRTATDQKKSQTGSISLMADASLIVPISLIARDFSRIYHVPVALDFGSPKEQVEKIQQGADANVFIASQPSWIKALQNQGMIDIYSRTNIASNQLALTADRKTPRINTQKNIKSAIRNALPIGDEEFKFGFADASLLSEGGYIIEAMTMLGLEKDLKMHYSLFKDMDSMAHAVENFGFYGAMYHSDTYLHPKLHAITVLSKELHSPILYQAVVVAGEHMNEARRFVAYLTSDAAQRVFQRYGFGTASASPTL